MLEKPRFPRRDYIWTLKMILIRVQEEKRTVEKVSNNIRIYYMYILHTYMLHMYNSLEKLPGLVK